MRFAQIKIVMMYLILKNCYFYSQESKYTRFNRHKFQSLTRNQTINITEYNLQINAVTCNLNVYRFKERHNLKFSKYRYANNIYSVQTLSLNHKSTKS